jgi:hypothetical protein
MSIRTTVAFGSSTYHRLQHWTARTWLTAATPTPLTVLLSLSAWTVRLPGNSLVLHPNCLTQFSRLANHPSKSFASSLAGVKSEFFLIPLTVVSTLAAEKGLQPSKFSTVQSRFSSIPSFSNVTFLNSSTAHHCYPASRITIFPK